ncbi:MAG: ABC transporter substrate-binding protein [Actinobacteria bacterium]|nr:ABC transporter substrate-binding protein [Actinomycetota bacterium]
MTRTRRSAKRTVVLSAVAAALALGVVPLGAGSAGAQAAKCPVKALASAKGPVEITMWHSMNRANEDALKALTDRYNASQSAVKVNLLNTTSYEDTFTKFRAGLGSGNLPDIVQLEDTSLQGVIDSQSVVPIGACIKADKYPTDAFIPRVLDYYTVQNTLYGMPFNVSNPVFYYNKQAFQKAGLDPEKPPKTLDEVRAAAQKIVTSGAAKTGYSIKLDPWYLEQWLAKAGKPYVNNGNGRAKRATGVEFDTKVGQEIFAWLDSMVDDKLALNTGPPEGNVDNLLAIGADNAAMTIDTSASLGTILGVLGGGQFPNVTIGVAPMPGPVGKGGVLVGGAALFIPKASSPERQAAAWDYIKFLNTAESQAQWSVGTGYSPNREDALDEPVLQAAWAKTPEYRVAYDQLVSGVNNIATAGPVIGPYREVRAEVENALTRMLTQGLDPKTALKDAATKADEEISSYNARVS